MTPVRSAKKKVSKTPQTPCQREVSRTVLAGRHRDAWPAAPRSVIVLRSTGLFTYCPRNSSLRGHQPPQPAALTITCDIFAQERPGPGARSALRREACWQEAKGGSRALTLAPTALPDFRHNSCVGSAAPAVRLLARGAARHAAACLRAVSGLERTSNTDARCQGPGRVDAGRNVGGAMTHQCTRRLPRAGLPGVPRPIRPTPVLSSSSPVPLRVPSQLPCTSGDG